MIDRNAGLVIPERPSRDSICWPSEIRAIWVWLANRTRTPSLQIQMDTFRNSSPRDELKSIFSRIPLDRLPINVTHIRSSRADELSLLVVMILPEAAAMVSTSTQSYSRPHINRILDGPQALFHPLQSSAVEAFFTNSNDDDDWTFLYEIIGSSFNCRAYPYHSSPQSNQGSNDIALLLFACR